MDRRDSSFPWGGAMRGGSRIALFALALVLVVTAFSALGGRHKPVCDLCGQPCKQWVEVSFSPRGNNIFAKVGGLGESPVEGHKVEWEVCSECHQKMMEQIRSLRR